MSDIRRNLLIGVVLAAALAGGLYFYISRDFQPGPTGPSATTTTIGGVTGTGSYTVEPVGVTPPSLDRPITISASLPDDAKPILKNLLEQQIEILRKEPTRVDIWLQYGVNRKIAGDYEGAIEAWEYVAQAAPKEMSATAHGNLGDLYMYFLKDYAKADTRFNQAIALNPRVLDYYRALFYLYRDIYKDTAKAEAIRALGIKNNPGSTDLQKL
jgi:hypothetical protein